MTNQRSIIARSALFGALFCLLGALPAMAQIPTFPRIGVSASPDHYEPGLDVHGDEMFELYVLALPPEDEPMLQHDYGLFHWGVLESCCGGSAVIVSEEYNPSCEHDGSVYGGVVTTSDECMSGESFLICTITLRMLAENPGRYYVVAGPLSLAQTCGQEGVVMTDLIAYVDYTPELAPTEPVSLSRVKGLFVR